MVTIYHNPNCGTSRNTLMLLRKAGIKPDIILYLETPPDRDELVQLIARMGQPVRSVLRRNNERYEILQLDDSKWSDDELIDFMIRYPILINRPIVVTPLGVRLCRPMNVVLEILTPEQQHAALAEEETDGAV